MFPDSKIPHLGGLSNMEASREVGLSGCFRSRLVVVRPQWETVDLGTDDLGTM